MTDTVRPCVYPGCRDHNGDPRLTDQTTTDAVLYETLAMELRRCAEALTGEAK